MRWLKRVTSLFIKPVENNIKKEDRISAFTEVHKSLQNDIKMLHEENELLDTLIEQGKKLRKVK